MKRLVGGVLTMLLCGCSDYDSSKLVVNVVPDTRTFQVTARGEFLASESITITAPAGGRRTPLNIRWLMPEYSEVSKGQVLARFDTTSVEAEYAQGLVTIAQQNLMLRNHERQSASSLSRITHELERVDGESVIASSFVDLDEMYFSRNELLDAISDLDYLEVQEEFYTWEGDTHSRRSSAETDRILAQRKTYEDEVEASSEALSLVALESPADGTFIYAMTPWGQKLSRSMPVFPGRPIGMIPVRGKVHARIFVPEVDAVGIAPEQTVTIALDTDVRREITGQVSSVSPLATTQNANDPRKFFVVKADIGEEDAHSVRVGSHVTATVTTGHVEDAIVLPQHSVFFEEQGTYVYVVEDDQLARRDVETGLMSPTLVEITAGLHPGETVSLVAPSEESV